MILKDILNKSINDLEQTGIPTPELDATILVSFVLKKDKVFLLTHPEYKLKPWQTIKINKLINRRKKHEPIAYITGHKEFYGYNFLVDKNTLIPRPETEFLVERALEVIRLKGYKVKKNNTSTPQSQSLTILDVGTGSGCIIISLAKELDKLKIANCKLKIVLFATDISDKALKVAKKNAEKLLISTSVIPDSSLRSGIPSARTAIKQPITFLHSDLFSNNKLPQKFDLILANLPYVPKTTIKQSPPSEGGARGGCPDIEYEPQNAIFADDNGTSIIKRFLIESKDQMDKNGLILIELDPRNAIDLYKFAKETYLEAKIQLKKDLAGRDRYLEIQS